MKHRPDIFTETKMNEYGVEYSEDATYSIFRLISDICRMISSFYLFTSNEFVHLPYELELLPNEFGHLENDTGFIPLSLIYTSISLGSWLRGIPNQIIPHAI